MPRIRELGIYDSALPPGPRNAISDVAGVTAGHFTLEKKKKRIKNNNKK